ncbi:MAG: hypothetical protein R6X06_07285 [Gammaproteobacteria bacterium]
MMVDQSISRFWEKYIKKTKSYGDPTGAIRWHVRHAESYIKSHINLKLAQHSEQQVVQFL